MKEFLNRAESIRSLSWNLLGREFPRRLCDPLLQYDFIVSAVVSL